MTFSRLAVVILVFLAAGCAGPPRAPDSAPSKPASVPQDAEKAPAPAPTPVARSKPAPAVPGAATPTPKVESPAPRAVPEVLKPEVPAPAPAAKAPAAPTPAPKKEATTPPAPKPAPLDLAALEKRLKDTGAIGVFTKLTLKNQVDELLDKFRAYYKGDLKTNLAQLRQPYDLLILKVLSLLQDGDPSLARAVTDSREAIWGILSDPEKFRNL